MILVLIFVGLLVMGAFAIHPILGWLVIVGGFLSIFGNV